MARVERDVTAEPDPGERILFTGDLRQFLDELALAGDDGDGIVYAKVTFWRGKIRALRARPVPPAPVAADDRAAAADWQNLAQSPPALPAAEADTDIQALAGTAVARPVAAGARHRK